MDGKWAPSESDRTIQKFFSLGREEKMQSSTRCVRRGKKHGHGVVNLDNTMIDAASINVQNVQKSQTYGLVDIKLLECP